jgi:putative holliday junction resolvase
MRVLAVDYGFKRIGIAVADMEIGLPSPRSALAAKGSLERDAKAIAELARAEEATLVVVGLPVELSGEEGRMARICKTLGDAISRHGFEVRFTDETLSSVAAETVLRDAGLKAALRKKLRDGEAASQILERFLNENPATP